LPTSFIPTRSD